MTTPSVTPAVPPADLAAVVEETVRGLTAVVALHRPGPWWSAAVREAGAALGLVDEAPLVAVSGAPEGALEVSVAVTTYSGAASACRAVHDAVADRLLACGYAGATVRVTVVRVSA